MGTLLPSNLTSTEISEIERFTKKYEVRVKMYSEASPSTYESGTPTDYSSSSGEYSITTEIWLKSFSLVISSGYDVIKAEYEDIDGNWVVAKTIKHGGSTNIALKYSVWGKKFRFTEYKESDPTDTTHPSYVWINAEAWSDISDYIGNDIRIENNCGDMLGSIRLPFVSISINNMDGSWGKQKTLTLPRYIQTKTSPTGTISGSAAIPKRAGVRVTVEIRFLGPDWEEKNWILLASFNVRKWSVNLLAGESGWVAKTIYQVPLVEGGQIHEIIDKYICRQDGDMLIQIVKSEDPEIVTVSSEIVGETYLEPAIPKKLIDGVKTHSFCTDGNYIYYSKKIYAPNTFEGGYIEIRKMLTSGEGDEYVGRIYAVPQAVVYDPSAGYDLNFTGAFYSANFTHINNNNTFQRTVRACYGMAVDGENLYISVSTVCNQIFTEPSPLGSAAWVGESLLYKLPKDGSGWAALVGPNVTINETKYEKNTYTASHVYSLGFWASIYNGVTTGYTYDYYDVIDASSYWAGVIRSLLLFDDSGVQKILFIKERNRNNTNNPTTTGSEFWVCNKDFSSMTQRGSTASTVRVEAIAVFLDSLMFVHWSTWSSGVLQSRYLGLLERSYSGDFSIASYGSAMLSEWFYSMQFILNGIYAAGNYYDGGVYNYTNESEAADGIKEKYNCVFQLGGFNICHYQHEERNDFLSNPEPNIMIGGNPISYDVAKYLGEYVDGEHYVTMGWALNLKTGELILRQAYASLDPLEVTASYDFYRSVMFYQADAESRLDDNGLGKLASASDRNYFINEAGMIERLKFIETQEIPVRHVINDYSEVSEDLGEKTDGGIYGLRLSYDYVSSNDCLTSFQFTPKFDGYLESFRIPVKILKSGTVPGGSDIPIDVDIYIADETTGEVDYMSTDGNKPVSPPTSADIQTLISDTMYISVARATKLISGSTYDSDYYWMSFDLSSASHKVYADKNYGLIIRCASTGTYLQYRILAKIVSNSNNRFITYQSGITNGSSITAISSSSWVMGAIDTSPSVAIGVVQMKRTKQELKSVDIVDSLNPNISSGFSSIDAGDDTSIRVRNSDLTVEYDRGASDDYQITYSGGRFYVDFDISGSAILDSIDNVVIVSWFDSKTDLLTLTDIDDIVEEQSEFGDHTTYLRTIVKGTKLSPTDAPARINKRFDLYPGILLGIESENMHQQKAEASSMYDWNEKTKTWDLRDANSENSSKFDFEFKDPFVTGTTGYIVRTGKGLSSDKIASGTANYLSTHDVPLFYRVNASVGFADDSYHVMLHPSCYKEWRLATSADYPDMSGNCVGTAPTSASDVKTSDHFYLKHMNNAFGESQAQYIAYESEEKRFYVDANGVLIEDDSYDPLGPKNHLGSVFPSKIIYVLLTPSDLAGNPMFAAHGVSGKDGYDSSMSFNVKEYHACKIDRADISAFGVDVIYSNFGVKYKRFLEMQVTGYPVNKQLDIKAERRNDGYLHADAKTLLVDNDLIQVDAIANRTAMMLHDFWGKERIRFSKTVPFDPRLRPGAIVKVTSEFEGLDGNMFYVTNPKSLLSLSDGLKTVLGNFLQL